MSVSVCVLVVVSDLASIPVHGLFCLLVRFVCLFGFVCLVCLVLFGLFCWFCLFGFCRFGYREDQKKQKQK